MPTFQSGVIAEASSDALFITMTINTSNFNRLKKELAATPDLLTENQQKFPDAHLHATIGISSSAWSHFDKQRPSKLTTFPHVKGEKIEIQPTDVDLVFHIRSLRRDVTYQFANLLYTGFERFVSIVEEVSCFKYLDNRDLTGFVDGTENPEGENRKAVALVGDEDSNYQNGSYLNLMRFVHDLKKWEKEDLKTQEDTYGRTKCENEEYPSKQKSLQAHTKRTSLKDEHGKSIEILRHSMPFASLSEKGLMFASYSKTPDAFNLMLESMVKGDEKGNTDKIMEYTQAKTGQTFFIPSIAWLKTLAND